jgi:hypothetical protein
MGMTLETVTKAKDSIKTAFKITDEGKLSRVIGMEFMEIPRGYLVHQTNSLSKILEDEFKTKINAVHIPMIPDTTALFKENEKFLTPDRASKYRTLVGKLLYTVTCTRPDLTFSVNMCARFVQKPTEIHEGAVKKILRYISGTLDHGLVYQRNMENEDLRLIAYVDSDFACDKHDSKSTTGYVIMLAGCAIAWRTTKQKSNATSTVEAEFMAASTAAKEVIWLHLLLTEILGVKSLMRPLLRLDNEGAEALSKAECMSEKTKHIRYTYHFLRECHNTGLLEITHISGKENPADMFTKPLAREVFGQHVCRINFANFKEVQRAFVKKDQRNEKD